MTDEIEATAEANDEARIRQATEAIRSMSDDLANELGQSARGFEPVIRRITDEVCNMTRQAPLQSLAIAFLLGVTMARRHR